MDDLILAEKLTKHFGAVHAVDGLDLRVGPGEIFGLVGPDGAGKTTTMRLLCGAYEPTSGRASVAGFDLSHHVAEARAATGYVPQRYSLYRRSHADRESGILSRRRTGCRAPSASRAPRNCSTLSG